MLQSSKLGFQTWAIAIYLVTTNLKGISSMKLHRELNITQRSAWHLAHRLRETLTSQQVQFEGPVEADETFVGGKAKNMHRSQRQQLTGRGGVDKVAVAQGPPDKAGPRGCRRARGRPDPARLRHRPHRPRRRRLHRRRHRPPDWRAASASSTQLANTSEGRRTPTGSNRSGAC